MTTFTILNIVLSGAVVAALAFGVLAANASSLEAKRVPVRIRRDR